MRVGESAARTASPNGSRPTLPTVQRPKVKWCSGRGVYAPLWTVCGMVRKREGALNSSERTIATSRQLSGLAHDFGRDAQGRDAQGRDAQGRHRYARKRLRLIAYADQQTIPAARLSPIGSG